MYIHGLIMGVMSQSLWISDEAFRKVQELNYRVFSIGSNLGGVISFGKENYEFIAKLRSALEVILASDMVGLHDVDRFLRRKMKSESKFGMIFLRHPK